MAMRYVENAVPINLSPLLPIHRERWKAELQTLMDEFRHNNLVHGDLRCPNIVCEGESVMLLDFDWGGRDGVVSYPTWKLNDELSVGRVSEDLKITKDDDRRVLANTLNSLGGSYVASHPIYSGFIKVSTSGVISLEESSTATRGYSSGLHLANCSSGLGRSIVRQTHLIHSPCVKHD